MSADPYWGNVVLAMRMNGVNNGTVFTEEKGKTVTAGGNVKTITAVKKFGDSSAYFDGNGDSLSLASTSDFDLGSGPMTIEFFFYKTAWTESRVLMFGTNGAYNSMQVNLFSNGAIWAFSAQGSAHGVSTPAGMYSLNTWHHLAIVLESTTVEAIYLDGVQKARATVPAWGSAAYPLSIGGDVGYGSFWLNGYIDDLRITKGVARYLENFTPPTATFPTNIAAVVAGVVRDDAGNFAARIIRAYDRVGGGLVGSTVSSAVDGSFEVGLTSADPCYVVALDDDPGSAYNALIFDRISASPI